MKEKDDKTAHSTKIVNQIRKYEKQFWQTP